MAPSRDGPVVTRVTKNMTDSATHSTSSTAAPPALPQVLLVGPWQQRELATALTSISTTTSWRRADHIEGAADVLHAGDLVPELILLAQPQPGLYCQTDIDRLQQLAPLSRLVMIAGTWCEGELRTGAPPTGVIRLYWYELAPWWQIAIGRYRDGLCPPWSLPLDAPQAGRWSSTPDLLSTHNSVLIHATDYATYESLAAALQPTGSLAHWCGREHLTAAPHPIAPTAGIWEGGQLSPAELAHLTSFCQQVSGPVAVLLDFPRAEHFQQARTAGATAIFGKPYIVAELQAALGSSPQLPKFSGK